MICLLICHDDTNNNMNIDRSEYSKNVMKGETYSKKLNFQQLVLGLQIV